MSKIVCDICGTTYDDSTGPCPVCGWNPGATLDPSSENIDDIMSENPMRHLRRGRLFSIMTQ